MWKIIREHRGIHSIPEVIFKSSKDFGNSPALGHFVENKISYLTYRELWENVKHIANGLKKLGVKPKNHCGIIGNNSINWALSYLGILTAGAITVPIDPQLKPYEIKHIIKHAKVKVIFVNNKFIDTILELQQEEGIFKAIILLEENPTIELNKNILFLKDLIELGKNNPSPLKFPKKEDIAAIIYTSGTTGKAKGVLLAHENIISDIALIYQIIEIGKSDTLLSILPIHHTFECTAGFLLPLYSGAKVVFARSLKSKYLLEDLKAVNATVMLGVPLLFQKMWEAIEKKLKTLPISKRILLNAMFTSVNFAKKFNKEYTLAKILFRKLREQAGFGNLRFFISGGAPLPPYLPKKFRMIGINLFQGYGLTEASPVLSVNPPHAPIDESVGICLPQVKVKVHNPSSDGVGELCFKGPMIMKGYYKLPELTKQVIDEEGFLHTGDVGYVDNKGYIYICGRKKNVIVTPAGKNVYPEEIEFLLDKSPYILESLVFGIPSKKGGEEVGAIIVPDYEAIETNFKTTNLTEKDIKKIIEKEIKKVQAQLADYKKIRKWILREEEFPKTSTRKIKRHLVIPEVLETLKT